MIRYLNQPAQNIPLHCGSTVPILHLHELTALIVAERCCPAVTVGHGCRLVVQVIAHCGFLALLVREGYQIVISIIIIHLFV